MPGEDTLRVWSLAGGEPECVATLSHGAKVMGTAISRHGGFVASAGAKKLIVWRAAAAQKR
jgi:hypothetical protein